MVANGKLSWGGNPNQTNLDEEAWYRHYAALLEWGKENGHCNIPVRSDYECETPDMVDTHGKTLCTGGHYTGKLGHWLDNQRTIRKRQSTYDGPNKEVNCTRQALLLNLIETGN